MLFFGATILETAILADMLESDNPFQHKVFTVSELRELIYKRYGLRLQDSELFDGVFTLNGSFNSGSCGLVNLGPDLFEESDIDFNERRFVWSFSRFGTEFIKMTPAIFPRGIERIAECLEDLRIRYRDEELPESGYGNFLKIYRDALMVWERLTGIPYVGFETEIPEKLIGYYDALEESRRKKYLERVAELSKDPEWQEYMEYLNSMPEEDDPVGFDDESEYRPGINSYDSEEDIPF